MLNTRVLHPTNSGGHGPRFRRRQQISQGARLRIDYRDMGSRVVMTWTHVPTMGKPFTTPSPADPPGFVFPPPPPPPHPNPCTQPRSRPPPPVPFPNPPPPPVPCSLPTPPMPPPMPPPTPHGVVAANPTAPPATGCLPKLSFPRFDGDSPRH